MADADEDVILPFDQSQEGGTEADDAEDDGAVDFRFLASLNSKTSSLPKRGEKDFEPHPTKLQASTLAASRQAMHDALDYTRQHHPKNHVLAFYNAETGKISVPKVKTTLFRSVGKDLSGGGVELHPEEALWALERGSLDIRHWSGSVDPKNGLSEEMEQGTIPMTLQGAYAAFLGDQAARGGRLTLEKYQVYAGLKRAGYIVLRAAGFDELQLRKPLHELRRIEPSKIAATWTDWICSLLSGSSLSSRERHRLGQGPLVKPGFYRTYQDIFPLLNIIPSSRRSDTVGYDAQSNTTQVATPFTTTYHVYKPSPSFRKSAPGPPAFRISVISARDTCVPTLDELSHLLEEQPDEPPSSSTNGQQGVGAMYARLKHGYKNVILAVVDQGIVSYMRVSDACFAQERLYENLSKPMRGGKGDSRGGNRGRLRGRGGRGR